MRHEGPDEVSEWRAQFVDYERVYRDLRRSGAWTSGPRSLLAVVGVQHLEETHSATLAWFLDPIGGHGIGTGVLEAFLAMAHVDVGDHDLAQVEIHQEFATTDPTSGRSGSIDIVIELDAKPIVVIEAKLWATETNDQLDRYAAAHPDTTKVYLTPFGTSPTRSTVARHEWRSLSWRDDIVPMLTAIRVERRQTGQGSAALEDYITTLSEETGA